MLREKSWGSVTPPFCSFRNDGAQREPAASARDACVYNEGPTSKETGMNWDRIEGSWKQMKGKVKEQWGKLTDDDLDQIGGKRDQLVGRIQKSYGIGKDEADKQLTDWESRQDLD
jgi:uncharacterized protein YjbJ (UPF0337 family)